MKSWRWLFIALVLAECDSSTDPGNGGVPEPQLNFLRCANPNVLTVRQASFWAVRGQGRTLVMKYANDEEFLEFEVRDHALMRRPDGTLFQDGDSVRITVTVDPNNRFIVYFEPSGLTFNPLDPAHLEINYKQANPDIDGDGDDDDNDDRLEARLRIWQQERLGLPWLPLSTLRIDEDDLEANVLSFTGFAMASN